jgi:AbrB family looped-hinge helix DNA binding protein
VTEKGQVTIPKRIREELGIRPGDEVRFERTEEGYIVRKEVDGSQFEKWRGVVDTDRSVEEEMQDLRGKR